MRRISPLDPLCVGTLCRANELTVFGTPRALPIAMLNWTITFFVIALIAGLFGFFGVAGIAATVAKFCFVGFLILAVVSVVTGRNRNPIV